MSTLTIYHVCYRFKPNDEASFSTSLNLVLSSQNERPVGTTLDAPLLWSRISAASPEPAKNPPQDAAVKHPANMTAQHNAAVRAMDRRDSEDSVAVLPATAERRKRKLEESERGIGSGIGMDSARKQLRPCHLKYDQYVQPTDARVPASSLVGAAMASPRGFASPPSALKSPHPFASPPVHVPASAPIMSARPVQRIGDAPGFTVRRRRSLTPTTMVAMAHAAASGEKCGGKVAASPSPLALETAAAMLGPVYGATLPVEGVEKYLSSPSPFVQKN